MVIVWLDTIFKEKIVDICNDTVSSQTYRRRLDLLPSIVLRLHMRWAKPWGGNGVCRVVDCVRERAAYLPNYLPSR